MTAAALTIAPGRLAIYEQIINKRVREFDAYVEAIKSGRVKVQYRDADGHILTRWVPESKVRAVGDRL